MARVLIIDDDDQIVEMLQKLLSGAGYEVLTALDGQAGINLYRKEQPDVVIIDIIMPEKDGAEVIYELQKEFAGVKMIAMTGGGGPSNAKAYLKSIMEHSQVQYAFEKPFAVDDMLKAVQELVNG